MHLIQDNVLPLGSQTVPTASLWWGKSTPQSNIAMTAGGTPQHPVQYIPGGSEYKITVLQMNDGTDAPNEKALFTECINSCSMFKTDADIAPYAGIVRQSYSNTLPSNTGTMLKTFCVCIPESELERMLVRDEDLCTVNYHTTSGRNGKGLFDGETYTGPETCDSFSPAQKFTLDINEGSIKWDPRANSRPACGFAYNDPSGNVDNYLSLYKTRNMGIANPDSWILSGAANTYDPATSLSPTQYPTRYPTPFPTRTPTTAQPSASPTLTGQTYSPTGYPTAAGGRRLLSIPEEEVFNASKAAREYIWDDGLGSRCDLIGRVVASMEIQNMTLRPLEQVEMEYCIQLRMYGETIAHYFATDDFPKYIFYTWQAKYLLAMDTFMGTYLYLNWAWNYNETNPNQTDITAIVNSSLMYPKTYMSMLKAFTGRIGNNYGHGEPIIFDDTGDKIFHGDEDLHEVAEDLLRDAMTVSGRIYNELIKHDIAGEWQNLTKAFRILGENILKYQGRNPETLPDWGETDSYNSTGRRLLGIEKPHYHFKVKLRRLASADLECEEDALVCTGCAIVDNLIDESIHGFTSFTQYYENDFPKALKGLNEAFESPREVETLSLTSGDVHKKVRRRLRSRRLASTGTPTSSPTREPTLSVDDLKWAAATKSEFLNATILFFDTTDDTKVPLYGHGLSYYLLSPFEDACDFDKVIYTKGSDVKSRLDNIYWGISVVAVVNILIFFLYMQYPILNMMPMFITQIVASVVVYLPIAYSYHPMCLPFIPHSLLDDLVYVFEEEIIPEIRCICQYLPELSGGCGGKCEKLELRNFDTNACSKEPFFDDMAILWAPAMFSRVYFPRVMSFMFNIPGIRQFVDMFESLQYIEKARPSATALDCMYTHAFDTGTVAAITGGSSLVVFFWWRTLAQIPVTVVKMTWLLVQQNLNAASLLASNKFSPSVFLTAVGILGALYSFIWALVFGTNIVWVWILLATVVILAAIYQFV